MTEPLDFCATKLAAQDRADLCALWHSVPLYGGGGLFTYVLLRKATAFECWAYQVSGSCLAIGWLLNQGPDDGHLVRALLTLPVDGPLPDEPEEMLDLMHAARRLDVPAASFSRRWSASGEGAA